MSDHNLSARLWATAALIAEPVQSVFSIGLTQAAPCGTDSMLMSLERSRWGPAVLRLSAQVGVTDV
ncbi:MAG: hypothetical protein ACRDJV_14260 [Actinomycetota bacterium]